MEDIYERKSEKKFCYFIKDYVHVIVVTNRWRLADGSWEERDAGIECPNISKCRKNKHNCLVINHSAGEDPFMPFSNLLADMW